MKLIFNFLVLTICVFTINFLSADEENVKNKWRAVGDGSYPPPKGEWPNLSGSDLIWIDELDYGIVMPILTEKEGKEGPGYRKFSFEKPQWEFVEGKIPAGIVPSMWNSPKSYVYLPNLKKVLVLSQKWSYSSNQKQNVISWLFDVSTATWEPLLGDFMMHDKSADFNTVAGLDGLNTPIWGSLCYDGFNKEALSIGGGGTWGRVGREKEKVEVGDWVYDEVLKRTRRLTVEDKGKVQEARRWFPANCGTWVFSEKEQKWSAIEQPLSQQPNGRILSSLCFVPRQNKIFLFGGDDLTKCYNDTWVYDCTKKTWSSIKTTNAPTARASAAFVYVPEQNILLLVGGYKGGWKPLKDVWAYDYSKYQWSQLALELPDVAGHASATYDQKRKQIVLASYPRTRGNKTIPIFTLQLDLQSVSKVDGTIKEEERFNYHCVSGIDSGKGKLPNEMLSDDLAVEKTYMGLKLIASQEANVWVLRKPPYVSPGRDWGSNIYDVRTHQAYAWGGGHSTYPGADVTEYQVETNRWVGMFDAPNYNPVWLHGMVSGPPGVSFGGWSLLPTHSRKSYGIDVLSNSLITYVGDVYDLKNRMFVSNIGLCPGKYGVADQVSFCSTSHGLYGYSAGLLMKADVKSGKWEEIAKGGPKHDEHGHLCYDSKRNRLLYFARNPFSMWVFDFANKTWVEEQAQGKTPFTLPGDSTYIPELDAVFTVFAIDKKSPEIMYFYKLEEHKWYTAEYKGDKFAYLNTSGRDFSPIYDPELKAIVRIKSLSRMEVAIMRLEPETLKLNPLE